MYDVQITYIFYKVIICYAYQIWIDLNETKNFTIKLMLRLLCLISFHIS